MKVAVGAYSPYSFQEKPGEANYGMDLAVGKEIPILSWSDGMPDKVPLLDGEQTLGLWFPVSFHMLWDLNDASSAIVNTDYRFGGIIKYVRGVGSSGWLNEWGVRFTPVLHESSHLGDELTLAGKRRNPTTFERINPSQYFTESLVSFQHYQEARGKHKDQTVLRLGFDYSWTSLYGADTLDTRNRRVVPGASSRFQPIVQLEHVFGAMNPTPSGGPPAMNRFEPFVSADVRRSIVYDLEKARASDPDKHATSVNLIFGLRRADHITRKGVSDFYVRLYHGVNPHGQFRTDPGFWFAGIGLSLDP